MDSIAFKANCLVWSTFVSKIAILANKTSYQLTNWSESDSCMWCTDTEAASSLGFMILKSKSASSNQRHHPASILSGARGANPNPSLFCQKAICNFKIPENATFGFRFWGNFSPGMHPDPHKMTLPPPTLKQNWHTPLAKCGAPTVDQIVSIS